MGREANEKKRRKRDDLIQRQDGKCHYCQCELTFDYQRKKPLATTASLFHLRDRFHPMRQMRHYGQKAYVVACWQCANDRGAESQASQPIDELRRRAGREQEFVWVIPGDQ